MIDPDKAFAQSTTKPVFTLIAGAIFGAAFGFFLQKGGVGKYHVLIGQLLLQDWTVAKIMLTAIVVGMIGVFTLHHFGKVSLHIKPTRIASNIIGGLLFGAGFALIGFVAGMLFGRTTRAMAQLGAQLQGKPTSEQLNRMQTIQKQQRTYSVVSTVTLILAVIFMSIARYM